MPGGRTNHLCWIADRGSTFLDGARPFLAEGRQRNERLMVVADGASIDAFGPSLCALGAGAAGMVADGSLLVQRVDHAYVATEIDVLNQLRTYERLVEEALRDGFAGLRVAADATMLATSTADRRSFLTYEVAVDRFMAEAPMSALCAYDHGALGEGARELCAVHPGRHASPGADSGFSLFYDDGHLCLTGEVDLANRDVLVVALEAALVTAGAAVQIDVGGLGFIDVAGLDVLRCAALDLSGDGRSLRLIRPSTIVRRTCECLGFPELADPNEAEHS